MIPKYTFEEEQEAACILAWLASTLPVEGRDYEEIVTYSVIDPLSTEKNTIAKP